DAVIHRLVGKELPFVAHHGPIRVLAAHVAPLRGTTVGRCVLERRAVHVADLQTETEEFPEGSAIARELDYRTILSVPLLREGVPLGAIALRRSTVEPFSEKHVELLQTFADQAVIAIENVRLFSELEARNRDLGESLEQQTATGEILRVISSSPTDVQPVFDTIVRSAARLCEGDFAFLFRYDGQLLHMMAAQGLAPDVYEAVRAAWPLSPSPGSGAGRCVLGRTVAHIPDIHDDPEYSLGDVADIATFRALVAVPMLRDGTPIGTLTVNRVRVGPYSDRQIELLKTFAEQAVIAIENVRLFREL